ncbi:MAG: hypothetical protein QOG82_2098 [Actinomycetota bacterium]|nr:hypothetical protein [Actinomycetota bacterium]
MCGALGAAPCPACASDLRSPPGLPPPAGVDSCRALLAYEGAGRELVARLKYRNARSSVPYLAERMAALAADRTPYDVVTWAPTTTARRRQRGFDQAELLARALARRLHVPCRRLLHRPPGNPQTGQPLDVRRAGPAFHPARPSPPRVLLVDDVVTSGATVTAAARTLTAAGAAEVHVVAAARTAPGRRSSPPGLHSERVAVCGSVVESRRQSQAKRPT